MAAKILSREKIREWCESLGLNLDGTKKHKGEAGHWDGWEEGYIGELLVSHEALRELAEGGGESDAG